MRLLRCLLISLLIVAALLAADPDLHWRNVAIGGGGYATGIVVHPTQRDLVVVRSDVGGLFKRRPEGGWIPLSDGFSVEDSGLYGVQSVALDPADPQRIWVTLGSYAEHPGRSGIWRSDDQGATWTLVRQTVMDGSPKAPRSFGEGIAVDPRDSRRIYAATHTEGLLRSGDGGATWDRVPEIPVGELGDPTAYWRSPPIGIRVVLVTEDSQVYVPVAGQGMWRSVDGGATFAAMSAAGCPDRVARLASGAGGDLFATHELGVARWRDGQWQDITPRNPDFALGRRRYAALAVDPADRRRVLVCRSEWDWQPGQSEGAGHLRWYRSGDGGDTWHELSIPAGTVREVKAVRWYEGWTYFSSGTSAATFHPGYPGRFSFTDFFQIWETQDITAPLDAAHPIEFTTSSLGYEVTCVLALASPTAGAPLLSGMGDVTGFRHDDLDRFPERRIGSGKAECASLDWCEAKPSTVVGIFCANWEGVGSELGLSEDGGATWIRRDLPPGAHVGRIAIDAVDPARLTYVSTGSPDGAAGIPWFSDDAGRSWQPGSASVTAAGLGTAILRNGIFTYVQPLAADRVLAGRRSLIAGGALWRSEDGGRGWTRRAAVPIPVWPDFASVAAVPGQAGGVWAGLGAHGLYRSVDGGDTVIRDPFFQSVISVGFGAPAVGTTDYQAFVLGRDGAGRFGLYASSDLGATWRRINGSATLAPTPRVVCGDRQVRGRVYIGTTGRGILVGEPAHQP